MLPELLRNSLGTLDGKTIETDLSDVNKPLQSFLLSRISDQNIFPCAASISSCVEFLVGFRDEAVRPEKDPSVNKVFLNRAKVNADLTRACEKVKLAAKVETGNEGTGPPDFLEKLLPL